MDSNGFLFVNPQKCVGCHMCEFACSLEKEGTIDPLKSRIRVVHISPFINLAITCRICEDTPCISACPQDALTQSTKTGAILVDDEKCNGCGWCIKACPYGAIRHDVDADTVLICDLCGGEPKCKEMCPEEAIEFVNSEAEIQEAWISISKKWLETSDFIMRKTRENIGRLAEKLGVEKTATMFNNSNDKSTTELLKEASEIMGRVEERYKELFQKEKLKNGEHN
ncbi:MAG: 4Fe-4S dicluster domain-containing protein [Thermoproteota archaeon]